MNNPYFSIVTAAYNRAAMIPAAIASVLEQTFTDWEYIIVDDGSSDNTEEVVKSYSDNRIRYIFQENKERSAARNNGILNAKGSYICFLDSDDYLLPNHLEILHKAILDHQEQVAMFATGTLRKNASGEFSQFRIFDNSMPDARFIFYHHIHANSVAIHKDIFRSHLFNEKMNVWEDIHLFVRIACSFPFIHIPEFTNVVVIHEGSNAYTLFKNANIPVLRQYIANILDAYQNHCINQHISKEEIKQEIANKILPIIKGAAWKADLRGFISLTALLYKHRLQSIFSKEYFEITKELLIYLGKKFIKVNG